MCYFFFRPSHRMLYLVGLTSIRTWCNSHQDPHPTPHTPLLKGVSVKNSAPEAGHAFLNQEPSSAPKAGHASLTKKPPFSVFSLWPKGPPLYMIPPTPPLNFLSLFHGVPSQRDDHISVTYTILQIHLILGRE